MTREDKEFLSNLLEKLIDSPEKAKIVFNILMYENNAEISSDLFEVLFKAQDDWNDDYWLKD